MQSDFHYYATYVAAWLAGYSSAECRDICYADQLADRCTRSFLESVGAPPSAATTQSGIEMANVRTDLLGRQDITRIWSSFHFLPADLDARPGKGGRAYREKYALICGPNGQLVADLVERAKGQDLPSIGLTLHTLADTWAHSYFAGTPSFVINNAPDSAVELVDGPDGTFERPITFRLSIEPDDLDQSRYTNTPYQAYENTIINLGHGRCGHLPDYSFARYRYRPAWGNYAEILKDNPRDYYLAFCQMVYAMRYLRGEYATFELGRYDEDVVAPYRDEIMRILTVRRLKASEDWCALAERLCGEPIPEFDIRRCADEYTAASPDEREGTFLGEYVLAALAQKSLVTHAIYGSGNRLAGRSIEYDGNRFQGIIDYIGLTRRGRSHG